MVNFFEFFVIFWHFNIKFHKILRKKLAIYAK